MKKFKMNVMLEAYADSKEAARDLVLLNDISLLVTEIQVTEIPLNPS